MGRRDWWYDERLREIRNRGMDMETKLNFAALNLRQAVKYSEPPDDETAERFMTELAETYAAMALNTMEHVTLRRAIRLDAERSASR